MCGIAGRVNFKTGRPVRPRSLPMCDLLSHRGPDGDGVWTDGRSGSAIAGSRSSICRRTRGQPMATEDGRLRITFNGEIYNFQELREAREQRGTGSARTGHRSHPRISTRSTAPPVSIISAACSRSPSGTTRHGSCSSPAIASARSRCTTSVDRDGLAFASEPKAFLADPAFEPRPDPGGDLGLSELSVRSRARCRPSTASASCRPAHT